LEAAYQGATESILRGGEPSGYGGRTRLHGIGFSMVKLRRGDVVRVNGKGDFLAKPRPAVIVQCNDCLALRESVTVCLLTSVFDDGAEFRPVVMASQANGLEKTSAVQVDKVATLFRENIAGDPVGRVSATDLKNISAALAFWLGLS
jgi:mRNA-degrading endonuclease toxin of MazEF toxin-antitoxin module